MRCVLLMAGTLWQSSPSRPALAGPAAPGMHSKDVAGAARAQQVQELAHTSCQRRGRGGRHGTPQGLQIAGGIQMPPHALSLPCQECMLTHTCTCAQIYMHVPAHTICTCTCDCIVCVTCVCMCTFEHMLSDVCTHECARVHACMCTSLHTFTHTRMCGHRSA